MVAKLASNVNGKRVCFALKMQRNALFLTSQLAPFVVQCFAPLMSMILKALPCDRNT